MTGLVRRFLLRRNMSSGHTVILTKTKQHRKECLFLFESPRSLFPSRGLWTAFSSLGTLDFLSAYLGIDSHTVTSWNQSTRAAVSRGSSEACDVKSCTCWRVEGLALHDRWLSFACPRYALANMHGLLRAVCLAERTQFKAASREITTQSSLPAWRIPWMEEPGGIQSMGSQKSWKWVSN